ncbi:MAG: FG-GAP repeat domain-containing protein, partial [Phycisphaerae bacterium]
MARLDKRRRLLYRWTLLTGAIALVAVVWSLTGNAGGEKAVLPGEKVEGLTSVLSKNAPTHKTPIRFTDVTASAGIRFRHFPVRRRSLLPEDMGSGVAVGDFDGDGFADLFFVTFAGNVIAKTVAGAAGAVADGSPRDSAGDAVGNDRARLGSRLYRNVEGRFFEDVTAKAGIRHVAYGLGAAWGDYDGDGDLDIYVTGYGDNALYRNEGDGTFRDVTAACGIQDTRFSAGCTWADYDRDGDLDLYVANYVDFVLRPGDESARSLQYATEQPYTLNPSTYAPQANALFRNNADGTFSDVAAAAGVADPSGRSLSATWFDFDNDGHLDLYVANDVSNNGVFRNKGDGTFADIGPPSLAADYRGAMGLALADVDHDLDFDLLVTHWVAQENALFRNMSLDALAGASTASTVWFMDEADAVGLGQSSLDMVGWATGFADFDNDSLPDLWIVNGSTLERSDDHEHLVAQRPFVYWNRGPDGFIDVASDTCPRLREPFVGRGGAQLDFDRDGRIDLVLMVHGGSPILLRNTTTPAGHWLRVVLGQRAGNTHAIGARVYITSGGKTQVA